jgi:hypothetical protein
MHSTWGEGGWSTWRRSREPVYGAIEGLAIAWLKSASQQAVDLLRLSWDEMHGIMERAVARRNLKRRAVWTSFGRR